MDLEICICSRGYDYLIFQRPLIIHKTNNSFATEQNNVVDKNCINNKSTQNMQIINKTQIAYETCTKII
jgi:hypothetical protein